jgi:Domain of unknown function (DUF4271)
MELELREISENYWITLIFVGAFILLAVTRSLYPRRFHEFFLLPITDKYFALEGKHYEVKHPFNFLLFSLQTISFTLFIFIILQFQQPDLTKDHPWLFVEILGGFLAFVLLKYAFEKLMAVILNIPSFMSGYLYEKLSYTNLISIYLLCFNILLFYAIPLNNSTIQMIVALLFVFQAFSIISSIKRNNSIIFQNIFYFILYLCALEIAPYILLYKVFV